MNFGQSYTVNISSMNFKDYFSTQSADYSKFRPVYPKELIDFLVQNCRAHQAAWDCATGNGQVALMLEKHFYEVIATDASEQQIKAATLHDKVTYKVATAENSGLPENYFDLITVAQAAHWFQLNNFFDEVKRVAKKGALIAVWGYANHAVSESIDAVVLRLYRDILNPYWPSERFIVEQGYRDIQLPFENIDTPDFSIKKQMNLHDLCGYLNTWSATQLYIKKNGSNPIEIIYDELLNTWGYPETERTISWPVFLKVARINN
jgi:ubiquinone/menaquinone biosynthesis C-methylase UbiE